MKRMWMLAVLGGLLCFSTPSYGKGGAGTGFYVGLGGSVAVENFDTDDLDDFMKDRGGRGVEVQNEWGINGKIGYFFQPWFALEFNIDYFPNFEQNARSTRTTQEGEEDPQEEVIKQDVDIEIFSYMGVAKFVDKFYSARPFVCFGLGYMDVEADMKIKGQTSSDGKTKDYNGACGKIGLGLDYLLMQNLSLGTEVSYVWGFGDVNDYRYLYWQVLNIALHF